MEKLKGIDVSVWNGSIDWSQAKKEIDFAILRAGYGREVSQKDQKFEANYSGCKANKIPMGVYWYNYAKTPADAKKEAAACIKVLKNRTFDYPVWYDVEEPSVLSTGKNNVSELTKVFCEALKEAGYKAGIYSSYSGLKNSFTDEVKNTYDVWVAHVGNGGAPLSSTSYPDHKEMWQYSWKGKIAGIRGDVDMDYCYKDYTTKEEKVEEKPVEVKSEIKPAASKNIDITYISCIGTWLGEIKNCNDIDDNGYSGLKGFPISGLAVKASEGTVRYRVHLKNGKWCGWITKYDLSDWNYGIAGFFGRVIDGIQVELLGCPGYQVVYRVAPVGRDYYPWVKGLEDYAGLFGNPIDRIQMKIEKV